jgi:hypothetical protein
MQAAQCFWLAQAIQAGFEAGKCCFDTEVVDFHGRRLGLYDLC